MDASSGPALNPLSFLAALIAIAFLALAFVSLARGELRLRSGRATVVVRRGERPFPFWALVGLNVAAALYLAWMAWNIRWQG